MQKQEKVVAFVGRSWAVYMGFGILWGLGIWTVIFFGFDGHLPVAMGSVMPIYLVVGGVVVSAWYAGGRRRLEVSDDGLLLSGLLGSRVIPWPDLVVVEPTWGWQWVRCRDAGGRATVRLTTSRLYPRLQHQVRRDNQELATRLWYASRAA